MRLASVLANGGPLRTAVLAPALVMGLVVALVMGAARPAPAESVGLKMTLTTAQERIQDALNTIDRYLDRAAVRLHNAGISGKQSRQALEELFFATPYGVDVITYDDRGVIRVAVPKQYRRLEGVSLADQPPVRRLLETSSPVLSRVSRAVEGYAAAVLQYPVVGPSGDLLGGVSLLFKPPSLVGKVLDPMMTSIPGDCWVMDTEGTILFDPDPEEIGRNLFSDPLYQPYGDLLALGRRIQSTAGGRGDYTFLAKGGSKVVTKHAVWTSVGLHGTYWRVVMTEADSLPPNLARRTPDQLGLPTYAQALATLAADPELVKAAALGDNEQFRAVLDRFYDDHPGLYSVQWIDATGMIRVGYPRATSPEGTETTGANTPRYLSLLKALRDRRPASFSGRLDEGGEGLYQLAPIWQDQRYLGMVYSIRVLP